ncbi:G2/M phase-specific E3 ubiquitin-protein ligase-like isoform X1 [Simochromis diagramma]|uniref:G2/M phase-specific E3 ubiquitin-protein ligase-like isoform X1 n=3 Tax=Simochromis diagramma TaxID=43689 RepID=UPI001A7E8804|nr:G2/M phase-specific E3 ubiquitin-protein ligase-like isoform X1 [Simochromis diagramma]
MYCPFCGHLLADSPAFCSLCGKNIKFLKDITSTVSRNPALGEEAAALPSTSSSILTGTTIQTTQAGKSLVESFRKFRDVKERERKAFFSKKHQEQKDQKPIKIQIGIMRRTSDGIRPVRGKSLPVDVHSHWSTEQILSAGVKKHKDFNQDMADGPYVLLYPDAREVNTIPGTNTPFNIQKYKDAIGKAYQRVTLYICNHDDFLNYDCNTECESEEDNEVQVKAVESPLSDTVVWDFPDNHSTPERAPSRNRGSNLQTSSETQGPCYSTYTSVYAPIVIDSDSDKEVLIEKDESETQSTNGLTAAEVLEELASKTIKTSVSRFNINRANVWDGAARGFRRVSYNPTDDILVKFSDDAGQREDGMDNGGPKREFLTLLMKCLRSRRIFDGPEDSKFLTFDSAAAREDEYFLAGRMIATSLVHGGPGPAFLSKTLYQHLIGTTKSDVVEVTIEDVTDEATKAFLLEISNAATLKELHGCIEMHCSLLQTAGCYGFPDSLDGKGNIIKDYLRWYIIYRNHFSIQRFKDGLATLGVIHALQQHPLLFQPFMCSRPEPLTSDFLEDMFAVVLSEPGSSRRQEETRVLGFWRDYLIDAEDTKTAVSLQDILMFATGLNSIPPAGMEPRPRLLFGDASRFPIGKTCANTIVIPMAQSYKQFQDDMDFGILNSPGFGLY